MHQKSQSAVIQISVVGEPGDRWQDGSEGGNFGGKEKLP